jgi:hypothetical protein
MFRKTIVSLTVGGLCCAAGAGATMLTRSTADAAVVPGRTQVAPMATKADEVREAQSHLKRAEELLSKADHDEKGDDYQAYKLTQQAIEHCDKFLKHRDNQ